MHGLLHLSWLGDLVATLILTQITIFAVTIYLHRTMAHRAVDLHPIASHFFRFWLWMTTGMVTKEWTAIHRKHHAKVETAEDPHSPQVKGIHTVLWQGAELYKKESRNKEAMDRYGQGTPDDWMERHVYTKHSALGITILLGLNLLLFGPIGLTIWAIQMAWIPFFAAGVINGIAHYFGYRNFECKDASRNILPWAFIVGGEELHNNHHTYATSAKFSVKWWEIDTGWILIRLLQLVGLAKPKRVPPRPLVLAGKNCIDIDTVQAVVTNRYQVMARYSNEVIIPVLRAEQKRAGHAGSLLLRRMRTLLVRESSLVPANDQQYLEQTLEKYSALNVVYQLRLKLQNIWSENTPSHKELIEALQEWCAQAEATGIDVLSHFVLHLKAYVPQKV
jgi:stearoyl-CoA desaturase (delta-9 desaturase)